jgi:Taurine catabolism dioxygenase TauD, TfdA family
MTGTTTTDLAWTASDLDTDRRWTRTLTNDDRDRLWADAQAAAWRGGGDPVRAAVREFLLDAMRTTGFAHVRNLADVGEVDDAGALAQLTAGFTFLLRQIGHIAAQDGAGRMTQVLRDVNGDGAAELDYHCDTSDLLVLLCLQQAAGGGGRTKLASSRAVVELIGRERPDALETLIRDDFWFDRRGRAGEQIIVRPIVRLLPGGAVDLYYQSHTVRNTPKTCGPPHTARQAEALAVLDEVLKRPATGFSLMLEPGDMLVIRNSRVLHGRSPYIDVPGPRSRRMLRIWMDTDEL